MNTHTLNGRFSVTMLPQASGAGEAAVPGRALLDKRYHGELDATGQGQMLSFVSGTPGSAGYVAIERVEGTLRGRSGSFVLQHSGLMNRGARQLTIHVVPDSGTGELTGLAGQMDIHIRDGQHFYELVCTLPS
jgi:hypothetical protein